MDIRSFLFKCSSNETYEKGNGWIDLLKPLIALEYKDRTELYAFFVKIRDLYIPRQENLFWAKLSLLVLYLLKVL